MNLREASTVLIRTHLAAIREGRRARAYEMISGPGLGKSSLVETVSAALCKQLGKPVGLMVNMLATLSQPDVRGFMLPTKQSDGTLISVFSQSPLIPRRDNIIVFEPDAASPLGYKRHPVGTWTGEVPEIGQSFLDEFAQGEDEVKKPAAEYVLKGEVGTNTLPTGWRVICASNRMSDRSGVVRPLMHIINRRAALNISGSYSIWNEDFVQKLAPEERPHFLTVSFAQKNPHIVFPEETPIDGNPFCTPRTLVMMDSELRALRSEAEAARDELPLDDLSREVVASWIGEGSAGQFFSHAKYFNELPSMEQVEKNPLEAKLPAGLDGQMVCAHMLSHNITSKNVKSVMRYMGRLNIEMQALLMRNVTGQPHAGAAVLNTPEFGAWVAKNKDLLIASRG